MNIVRSLNIEAEAAQSLLANIRDVIGDDSEMALVAIEGETELVEIIRAAVARINLLEGFAASVVQHVKELDGRRERFEKQAELLRAAVLAAMGTADLKKLELPGATLSRKAVAPKAQITNEADIPSKFWKPSDPKLDRKAVLEALKAKEAVPGAELSNGGETLAIRVA
jgi:hypothetical protein